MTKNRPLLPSASLRRMMIGVILVWAPCASADLRHRLFPHEVDVITVTDMTKEGRLYPNATPANPVYYMIIDVGQQNVGWTWAGEKTPDHLTVRKWIMAALAEQNYRLADERHPPTQLLVFSWGIMEGSTRAESPDRPGLKFLGGDKVDLMWEQERYGGFVNARVLLRGIQRKGLTGKIWDIAQSDLFFMIVRSYSMDSLEGPKTTSLWETRFACPASGLAMDATMPLLIKAAAPNLGRETTLPVNLNATRAFGGRVDFGELKVLEYAPSVKKDGSVPRVQQKGGSW